MGKPVARSTDTALTCNDPADVPAGKVVAVGNVFVNGLPVAKQGDRIVGLDTHILMVPSPGGPVPTPTPHPFAGLIDGSLSSGVKAQGMPLAVAGSTATNTPPHTPSGPGTFAKPPTNRAKIVTGSSDVLVG